MPADHYGMSTSQIFSALKDIATSQPQPRGWTAADQKVAAKEGR